MTQGLAVREPRSVRLDTEQIKYISDTEFVPKTLRGNLPAILACVATGRELGIGDLEALRDIYVVDGKPTLSAELMVKLARRRGHSIKGDVTAESATVTGTRGDNGDTMTVTWTLEMAKRAKLTSKSNWTSYPEAMLWCRAASQLCRMLFPDVLAGVVYTPDEAELSDEDRVLEMTDVAGPPSTPAPVDTVSGPEPQVPQGAVSGAFPASEPAAGEAQSGPEEQSAFPIPDKARNQETGG